MDETLKKALDDVEQSIKDLDASEGMGGINMPIVRTGKAIARSLTATIYSVEEFKNSIDRHAEASGKLSEKILCYSKLLAFSTIALAAATVALVVATCSLAK